MNFKLGDIVRIDDTPYEWDKEHLRIVKRGNHEIIYRIPYED